MKWIDSSWVLARKYRNEIAITIAGAAVGVVFGKIVDRFTMFGTVDQIILGLLAAVIFFLLGLAFTIKRHVTSQVVYLQQRVGYLVGRNFPTQYDIRQTHFPEEKSRLADYLVRSFLPQVLQKRVGQTNQRIIVLVDSGTTFEAFFPRIKFRGMRLNGVDIVKTLELYTNSLSGSDAFCREAAGELDESQLHLFGGTQVEKYRAVLGSVTLRSMDAVKEERDKKGGTIIGLVTANWLLVGNAYDKLRLCSTEPAHLAYKRRMAELSDELIVVAPLGKLLKLDQEERLNSMLKLEQEGTPPYAGFSVDEPGGPYTRTRENTHLLTTYRASHGSVLHAHSESLRNAHRELRDQCYTLCPRAKKLKLDHKGSRDEQVEIEMPHEYLREHSLEVLLIP